MFDSGDNLLLLLALSHIPFIIIVWSAIVIFEVAGYSTGSGWIETEPVKLTEIFFYSYFGSSSNTGFSIILIAFSATDFLSILLYQRKM